MAVIITGMAPASFAVTSQSSNFVFDETSLGGVGTTNTQSSTDYKVSTSVGIIGFGTSADASLQIKAGHQTTNDPALAFGIDSSNVNFGTFSAASTAVGTASFQAIDYTSYGYVVQIEGSPLTLAGSTHTIPAMAPGAPQVGTEQYGINLVANTSPTIFGANPNDGQFGYGVAATGYNTANSYQYNNGDTIASSPKSSGQTIFTISYIVDVSGLTPGGEYTTAETLICTATY